VRKKNPGILYIWLEADGNHPPGLVLELLRGLIRALRQTRWARLRGFPRDARRLLAPQRSELAFREPERQQPVYPVQQHRLPHCAKWVGNK